MTPEKRIAPITNWNFDLDKNGKVLRYFIATESDEYGVVYEIKHVDDKWYPKIIANGFAIDNILHGFNTAEDALAALAKRSQMM